MDATPDYSKCSLRELRDVAARINKAKYPERYALVLREIERHEIERHESAGDERPASATEARDFARRPFTLSDALTVFLFWAGGIALGAIAGALVFSVIFPSSAPEYGDGIGWGSAMLLVAFAGSVIGGVAGLCRGVIQIRET